jgi:hypothetical protein
MDTRKNKLRYKVVDKWLTWIAKYVCGMAMLKAQRTSTFITFGSTIFVETRSEVHPPDPSFLQSSETNRTLSLEDPPERIHQLCHQPRGTVVVCKAYDILRYD